VLAEGLVAGREEVEAAYKYYFTNLGRRVVLAGLKLKGMETIARRVAREAKAVTRKEVIVRAIAKELAWKGGRWGESDRLGWATAWSPGVRSCV
jgi:hypothetical protein